MRKFLAVIAMVLLLTAPSYAAAKFVTFPGLGTCTGTYVRYRAEADTNSEILGRLNTPEQVIILSQTSIDGDIWYEIEDPHGEDVAWIFGKYIVPVFSEKNQRTKTYSLMVDILQNYGITRDKGKFYDGPKAKVRYSDGGYLKYLEISRKGSAFGEIQIGDGREKIAEVLGDNSANDDEFLVEYRLDEDTCIRFILEDDVIQRMVFER
ncbi:MAG: SH3 domain-containing protein [Synergistales bacterium]|nr:SH3 domain-containing protein [Synergistales bacterium]MDY6401199.1 SH3 domain-containing protein [Synergistales bacterium]MDY6404792.1 SH3 domain-containing protein [Synergistales bacterium]MDY6410131.1 SH3 domain-containing protein [Synergistales bacterium]MDY6414774.1 SH3 domain-containing protein [Synergistales bacterium]